MPMRIFKIKEIKENQIFNFYNLLKMKVVFRACSHNSVHSNFLDNEVGLVGMHLHEQLKTYFSLIFDNQFAFFLDISQILPPLPCLFCPPANEMHRDF